MSNNRKEVYQGIQDMGPQGWSKRWNHPEGISKLSLTPKEAAPKMVTKKKIESSIVAALAISDMVAGGPLVEPCSTQMDTGEIILCQFATNDGCTETYLREGPSYDASEKAVVCPLQKGVLKIVAGEKGDVSV